MVTPTLPVGGRPSNGMACCDTTHSKLGGKSMSKSKSDSNEPRPVNNDIGRDEINASEVKGDPDDLSFLGTVPANGLRLAQEAQKDHSSAAEAYYFEGVQNIGDAFFYHRAHNEYSIDTLKIRYRIDPEENTVEFWDNAGGMKKDTFRTRYLTIGNPGDVKDNRSTAGDQGKGFWGMISWCDVAYPETYHHSGERWTTKASPVHGPSDEIVQPETPRPELDSPGTYVKCVGVDDEEMETLTNWETINDMLQKKFGFLLALDDVDMKCEIVGDGTYEPDVVDLTEIREQAELDYREELEPFTRNGEERVLENLVVIDQREVEADIEPPWRGVAMVKGGEDAPAPYMAVHHYTPDKNPAMREPVKMWGWVNADALCDDLEKHGHIGFKTGVVSATPLKGILEELYADHFRDDDPADEQEKVSRNVTAGINEAVYDYDIVNEGSGGNTGRGSRGGGGKSTSTTKENRPRSILCSTGKKEYDVDEEIPVSIKVTNKKQSETEQFEIYDILVKRTRDENGEEIPLEDTDRSFATEPDNIAVQVEPGSQETVLERDIVPPEPGVYVIKAKLREQPEMLQMNEYAKMTKPEVDRGRSIVHVGDIDVSQSNDGGAPEVIHSTTFDFDPESPKRASIEPLGGGQYNVAINTAHPEFKAWEDQYGQENRDAVKQTLGTKWGVERISYLHAASEVKEKIEEADGNTGEVVERVDELLLGQMNRFDEFLDDFVPSAPIQDI